VIHPGKMRFRVSIEQRTDVQGASGEQLDTWNLFASRRAARVAMTGTEQFAAQQQFGRVPTIFTVRYIDGVLPSMRLREGVKLYEIVSAVDPDGTKEKLTITTLERVGEVAS
jgi:SPP1 family predicted phage head-tail adaptor